MNPSLIERMNNQPSKSYGKRKYKGKKPITKGEKFRIIKASNLLKTRLDRLKQVKVRYDTRRRAEMPNEADDKLDNMIYANFLGDKYGDNGAHYNNSYSVNLRYCDSMREEEEEDEELFQAKRRRFIAQEYEREAAIFEEMMNYCLFMQSVVTSKRPREQRYDEEEPKAKRARCDDESNNV